MKKIIQNIILAATLLCHVSLFAQAPAGADCSAASQICPSSVGVPNTSGDIGTNDFGFNGGDGCLAGENGSSWYYMYIDPAGAGNLTMNAQGVDAGGGTVDIDGAIWGPYNSLADGCAGIASGDLPARCSYASGTGIELVAGAGDDSEDSTGNGQVNDLPVIGGSFYIVFIDDFSCDALPCEAETISVTFGGSAVVSCQAPPECAATCADASTTTCNSYVTPDDMTASNYQELIDNGGESCFNTPVDVSAAPASVTQCFEYTHTSTTSNAFQVFSGTSVVEVGDTNGTTDCNAGISAIEIYGTGSGTCTVLASGGQGTSYIGVNTGEVFTICVTGTADNGTAEGACRFDCLAHSVTPFTSACEASDFDIEDGIACSASNFTLDYTGTPVLEASFQADANGDSVDDFICSGFVAFAENDASSMLTETSSGNGIISANASTLSNWNNSIAGPNIVGTGNMLEFNCSNTPGTGIDFNFTNNTCQPITIDVIIVPIYAVFDGNPGNAFLGYLDVTDDCIPAAETATITIYPNLEVVITTPVDCAGSTPTAELRVVGTTTVCDTQIGTAGMDMPTNCSDQSTADGSLDYDFTANVAGWPATCLTTPMMGSSASSCQCLPVELLYLEATAQEATNVLTWATATELDNSHFEVERSLDGQKFELIGKVAGNGTTLIEHRYEYVDAAPLNMAYYRLKQVDTDGQFEYSDIVIVNRASGKGMVEVFPIPTKEELTVQYEVSSNSNATFTLTDVVGRVLSQETLQAVEGSNTYLLDMSKYTTGLYFITYSDGTTEQTRRIVKN